MEDYIVGLGEILFDCLPDGKKLGGAPANFAFHASQFGLNGIAVSAIGKDINGDEIKQILEVMPCLNYHLEEVAEPTGTVQVTLSGKGIPQYDICYGVAYDNVPWTEKIESIAKKARAVCFGSLAQRGAVTRETIRKFLSAMQSEGALKVFDINLRQHWYSKDVIEESLRNSNVLKLNDEEIGVLTKLLNLDKTESALECRNYETQCREIMHRYCMKMVILTCGTQGSYVFYDNGYSFQPTPVVTVVDTVGAGDSFTGSFVACVLQGKTIPEAHKIAVDVSAYVCTQPGAMPFIPNELIR